MLPLGHTSFTNDQKQFCGFFCDQILYLGTSFKVGKSYDQAKNAFLKAADAHAKNHSYPFSRKNHLACTSFLHCFFMFSLFLSK